MPARYPLSLGVPSLTPSICLTRPSPSFFLSFLLSRSAAVIRFAANLITLSTAIPFGTAVLEGRAPCLLCACFGALIEKVAPSRKLFNMPNNFAYLIRRERQGERESERETQRN